MNYTYDTYEMKESGQSVRVDTTTDFDEAVNLCRQLDKIGKYAFTKVTDLLRPALVYRLDDEDSWDGFRTRLERDFAWKKKCDTPVTVDEVVESIFDLHTKHPEFSNPTHSPTNHSAQHASIPLLENPQYRVFGLTAIDPPHYQGFLVEGDLELQWLEAKCREELYRNNPDHFVTALMLQIDKYLGRVGKKDAELQELQKGLWYYKFMVAYIKNGKKPIFVKDVEAILAR